MSITNTRSVQRIETYPAQGDDDPTLMVVYEHVFDDSEDDALPVTTTVVKHLSSTSDVANEDQLVKDICAAVWAD